MKFKLQIQQRGGTGIRGLRRIFNHADFNGNKTLDIQEFEQALNGFGIFVKKVELQALMKYYDINQDGNITYEEFLNGLKDPLTPRREAMVKKAFAMMDKSGDGYLSIQDIEGIYDVSKNPEFLEGRKTKDEILNDFLANFEGARGDRDGKITWKEFYDYYSDLSMSLPSEQYFVEMMESTWQIPENENEGETKQVVNHLYTEVRNRIQQLARNDPNLYKKIFNDFDLSGTDCLTIDEVTNMIAKLQISVERKFIYPFFKIIDTNNSGTIEFDEWQAYLNQ